jgi:hypothetical protein
MLGSENCGEFTGPIVISAIGAPLELTGAPVELAVFPLELEEAVVLLALLLQAATAIELAIAMASPNGRFFKAPPPSEKRGEPSDLVRALSGKMGRTYL